MFEFLFKRPGDAPGGEAAGPVQPAGDGAAQVSPARAQQAEKLAQLGGDEQAAADFILQCEFSDLRLAAADLIHSPPLLERVHGGIRNADRRVAKLLQARLDAWRHHEAEVARGQACIAQAEAMAAEDKLTPNQVADLDRKWSVIKAPELDERFGAVRQQLGARLEAQVMLQRAAIDRLNALRQLEHAGLSGDALAERLAAFAQEQDAMLAAPEHASLPRSLVNEFANEHARLSASIAAIDDAHAAIAARETALGEWSATNPPTFTAEQLKRAWQLLPAAPASAAADLQRRFEELLARLPAQPAKEARAPREPKKAQPPEPHLVDALDAMEAALQHGSLGTAAEHDKTLKDARGARLTPQMAERLAQARAELKRLSDWARWGGNVSREELIKAVEQLGTQKIAMSELAKKVGSMRDRWKALDTLSGSAPRSLWERFDAACTAAYAPAAAHFKHLADERHSNAAKAQALIDEARQEAARMNGADAPDWKHMAATVQRLRLAWSHLGAIDRKEKKRLDQQFSDVLVALQGPLEQQRKGEVDTREALIAQVAALNPHDRNTLDTVRAVQEAWQRHARALPLERKAEQALWQKFRAACDAVFAARKESAHAADAERRAHQTAKEAICERLETAALGEIGNAAALLREASAEWHAAGAVPRAVEAKLEKRYHAAQAAVQQRIDAARRQAGLAQASALRDKLRLVQQLEAALAATDAGADSDWEARWSGLPALSAEYEKALGKRFEAALKALTGERAAYAARLERNRAALMEGVLRLEIAAGIDSGSEFARERLRLQVESLQSSLKSGQKQGAQSARFVELIAMPALVDDRTATRIEQLFTRLTRDGK